MSEEKTSYISKTVVVNGESITLYSQNGMTWLSRPDDIPSTMERLENHRITLNDPKAEGGEAAKKAAKDRFKPRGPRGAPPTVQTDKKVEDPEIFEDDMDVLDELENEPLVASDDDDGEIAAASDDDAMDEGEEKVAAAAKPKASNVVALPAPKKAALLRAVDDDEEEDEKAPAPKATKAAPKLKAVPSAPAKKAAPPKAAAKAKPKAAAKPAPKAASKKKVEKKAPAGKKKK